MSDETTIRIMAELKDNVIVISSASIHNKASGQKLRDAKINTNLCLLLNSIEISYERWVKLNKLAKETPIVKDLIENFNLTLTNNNGKEE